MPSITYPEPAHTANVVREVAETAPLYEGLPNRLLNAFEVAEFVGCHEETVRRAYWRGLLGLATLRRPRKEVSSRRRPRLDSSRSPNESLVTERRTRMAVRKPCRSRGCKSSPRCEHPWWLDVMHNRERYRMPVDDFALARGATAPVTSKQEAEKVWEPKFIAEIVSGKDPRVPIERETKFERPTTVADLLKLYRTRYVEVEPLKSRAGMLSQLNVLSAQLGTLPATALERPDAIEDFKARYANRAIATTNRYLARLRHVCNWAIGRDLLTKTAFHPRGVRIPAKAERRRERRVSEAEEQRLLEACKLLNEPTRSMAKLTWDDVHEIRARARPASSNGTSRQRSRSRDRCAARSSAVTSGIRRSS